MAEYIKAHYYIETTEEPEKEAALIAKMQSTGTWSGLEAETEEIMAKHGARVASVTRLGEKQGYSLPTRLEPGKPVHCAEIAVEYPCLNMGAGISMLLSTVAGEIYDLKELTAVKVTDIEFPAGYLSEFSGPKFGAQGSKFIVNAGPDRPLFGAITKPCVGLTPEQIAKLAYEASVAGADFIKDDELLADAPYNRIADRAKAVAQGLKKAFEETGRVTMYAINVTSDAERVLGFHDIVRQNGGRAIMFNVLAGGFPVLNMLAKHTEMPIHCHRDFSVAAIRSDKIGISSALFTKLTRMCGGDQIQCGGMGGYLYETDHEVLENFRACSEPLGKIRASLPVSSGGMWAGLLPYNLRVIGHNEFMFLAGGGVFSHPSGGRGGMRSILAAFEQVKKGRKLEESQDKDLLAAIQKFGKVVY